MNRTTWIDPDDVENEQVSFEQTRPVLVSLHFLKATLRRKLAVCVLSPVLGLLAAVGFMAAFPPSHAATASLVLTADPQQQSSMGMTTDVSLLRTQTLASRVTAQLGLTMTPDEFLGTISTEQTGTELLGLTLKAPDDAEAVRRLDVLTQQYLQFRGEQLSYQSQMVVNALQDRIDKLKDSSTDVTNQIATLSNDQKNAEKLNEAIAQRAAIQSRIDDLVQSQEDATLQNSAVVASSRVLDPPLPEPGRALKNTLLGLASGALGGTALGWGGVLLFAITSSHLRRRADVAATVGADVRTSVGRTAPPAEVLGWLPGMQVLARRRADERQLLAATINAELVQPGRRTCLAVAGVDNGTELKLAVAEAATELAVRGCSVTLIDLTGTGRHKPYGVTVPAGSSGSVTVLRPRGVPALTHVADDLIAVGLWDEGEETPRLELHEVTLVVAELEPATGAGHLAAWTDRVLLAVTAGRSSVEKVRTVADQVRAAGLELRGAALLRTERSDDSAGSLPSAPVAEASAPLLDAQVMRRAGA